MSTTKGYQYVYDAWDRLVTVKTPAGVVAEEFRYNGLGHRIGWHYDSNSSGTVNGSDPWVYFQHNEKWQEVAVWEGTATTSREVFTYGGAGLDGYGGSSYIDDVVCRERDIGNRKGPAGYEFEPLFNGAASVRAAPRATSTVAE